MTHAVTRWQQFKAGTDFSKLGSWSLYRWNPVTLSLERFVVNDTWEWVADAESREEAERLAQDDFEREEDERVMAW